MPFLRSKWSRCKKIQSVSSPSVKTLLVLLMIPPDMGLYLLGGFTLVSLLVKFAVVEFTTCILLGN